MSAAKGEVHNVRWFDRALMDEEIRALAGECEPLTAEEVARWTHRVERRG